MNQPQLTEGIPDSDLPGPYPVGSYAERLRRRLREFARVQLVGEVWGFKAARARVYFELRDDRGALPCSMWLSDFEKLGITLADGMKIVVGRGCDSLADLFAFCDEALCRTVALLRVPVISSVGHHTDRTLIDNVAAVSCSTPTHAVEAAVPIDCRAARADIAAFARRLHGHGRRAILDRARSLTHLARSPAQH